MATVTVEMLHSVLLHTFSPEKEVREAAEGQMKQLAAVPAAPTMLLQVRLHHVMSCHVSGTLRAPRCSRRVHPVVASRAGFFSLCFPNARPRPAGVVGVVAPARAVPSPRSRSMR